MTIYLKQDTSSVVSTYLVTFNRGNHGHSRGLIMVQATTRWVAEDMAEELAPDGWYWTSTQNM